MDGDKYHRVKNRYKIILYIDIWTGLDGAEQGNGAQGRNRTTDTRIFSPGHSEFMGE
jgi:hypothetical protein